MEIHRKCKSQFPCSAPAPKSVQIWVNLDQQSIYYMHPSLHRIPLACSINIILLSQPQTISLLSSPTTALFNSCISSAWNFSLNLGPRVPPHLCGTVYACYLWTWRVLPLGCTWEMPTHLTIPKEDSTAFFAPLIAFMFILAYFT